MGLGRNSICEERVPMTRSISILTVVATAGLAASANAGITFSDFQFAGSLAGGAQAFAGAFDVDLVFPLATVGDPVAPLRAGTITMTFLVDTTEGEKLNLDVLSILGAVAGNGTIIFNEIIEDREAGHEGEILANVNVQLDKNNPPPQFTNIAMSRASSSFKVKKTIILSAADSDLLDLASIALIEQTFVPTPGSLALLGLGGLITARRRR